MELLVFGRAGAKVLVFPTRDGLIYFHAPTQSCPTWTVRIGWRHGCGWTSCW